MQWRAKAYAAAGVDAMFFIGLKRAPRRGHRARSKLPIVLAVAVAVAGTRTMAAYLGTKRSHLAPGTSGPVMAAVRAVHDPLKRCATARTPRIGGVASDALMHK